MMLVLASVHSGADAAMKRGEFLALCYHAVLVQPEPGDGYSISRKMFVEQMEYLRTHGYNPVSFKEILDARDGRKDLPDKPVLLTFDDAYISYYDFVVPTLKEFGYPSLLAVIGNFVGYKPKDMPEPVMTWEQIKEVSSHKLVEVVSHTYDLHKGIQYTPQGNVGPAVSALAFDPEKRAYETEMAYRDRIEEDFTRQKDLFRKEIGTVPEVVVWPYGKYNHVSLDVARKYGFSYTFTLEKGLAHVDRLDRVNRVLIENRPMGDFIERANGSGGAMEIVQADLDVVYDMEDFIEQINKPEGEPLILRAVQVDLDLIYDPDMEQMNQNLGRLIDRLFEMKVNTVFLQAFADPEGTGNIESVYFHNSVLPVRADIFGWAAHQISIRGITVFAWMPTLSIVLPDKELNERLRVREIKDGEHILSTSWYRRLTPFSRETSGLVGQLYEDLASHSQIHGILFQDDAYLTDYEDFHPDAISRYKERFGRVLMSADLQEPGLAREWARYKTEVLIDFTDMLKQRVRRYRPAALFARNLYGIVMEQPESEAWFAQDYGLFLKNYDHVVVMAYPQMEEVKRPSKWLKNLVGRARVMPQGIEKTVFKIQTYNWKKEEWIGDRILLKELRDVLSSGGRHLAYYPDNYEEDRPALKTIKLEMSTRTYPFIP